MKLQRIIPDKIDIYSCHDCPFFSVLGSTKVIKSGYKCNAYEGWPLHFKTRPKPDFCKIKRIEIYEEEEGVRSS